MSAFLRYRRCQRSLIGLEQVSYPSRSKMLNKVIELDV
jgi:hypothetical protein